MNLKKYFTIWWIPLISYLFIFGIFALGCILQRDWIIDAFIYLFFINIFGVIISCIVQIFLKKWWFIIPQIIITGLLFFYVSFIFTFSPPDYYGVHKDIPEGIKIYEPINRDINDTDFLNHQLVLSSSFQPGIYTYYTNYIPNGLGYFYIKVFEITTNDRLSKERIKERSKIKIDKLNTELHSGRFTIYEGDWGYKYGSRIELWLQPNKGKEFKVTERNYIVEGWMR